MSAIGEQVNVRVAADNFSQPFADLTLQETHDLAYSLQGKALAAKLEITAISVSFCME
jgi:hypothetical protein